MKIIEVTEITQPILDAFARLLPQLSSSAEPLTQEKLSDMIQSKASIVFIAVDDENEDKICGTLTLAVFRIPTGVRSWIEDVIVDEAARGKGIGELLVKAAIARAKAEGAITVDLTSRPSREAANRLYVRCGFDLRQTNIYRYAIEKPQ